MNKKTRALDEKEVQDIFEILENGYKSEELKMKPHPKLYMICLFQLMVGLRIGDILKLREKDIRNGRLNIVEEKTGKTQTREISENIQDELHRFLTGDPEKIIFDSIGVRAIQLQLQRIGLALGMDDLGTHSFRKTFATQIYKDNEYNIELVKRLLNHCSPAVTQRYIGVSDSDIEKASKKMNFNYRKGM